VLPTIDLIRADDPRARIALLTVFSLPTGPSPALSRADHVIVTAARDADPHVIMMDPLTGRWKFQHADNGLHPTAAGDQWIARKVALILRADGVAASHPVTARSASFADRPRRRWIIVNIPLYITIHDLRPAPITARNGHCGHDRVYLAANIAGNDAQCLAQHDNSKKPNAQASALKLWPVAAGQTFSANDTNRITATSASCPRRTPRPRPYTPSPRASLWPFRAPVPTATRIHRAATRTHRSGPREQELLV
jgi:hypothetical protein